MAGQGKGTLNCSPLLGYDETGNGPASRNLFLYCWDQGMHPILIGSL